MWLTAVSEGMLEVAIFVLIYLNPFTKRESSWSTLRQPGRA